MGQYDYFKEKKLSFAGRLTHNSIHKNMLKILNRFTLSNGRILEIGPGIGGLAQLLINSGYQYCCVDRNSTLVEFLKSKNVDAQFAEVPPIPFGDDSFDCVVLVNVFEHMTDSKSAILLMNDVRRVLKKGGKLFMIMPHSSGWGDDFYDVDYTHSFPVSPERIRQVLSDVNLTVRYMALTYGCVAGIFGLLANLVTSFIGGILYKLRPLNGKFLKAKILFHPVIWVVGEKLDK